jgi:hypothetical protein
MKSTIGFGERNSGLQVGVSNGPIIANFNYLPSILHKSRQRVCLTDLNIDGESSLPIIYEAAFDSFEEQHEDICLAGTSTDVLDQIRIWASSPQARCIFWLNGMAGTGKSTISRTVARFFSQEKSLGASFFFKRGGGDRGNATKIFPSLAGQLAHNLPPLRPIIHQAIQDNPGIVTQGYKRTF